jgi:hypothetical protein
MFSTWKNLSWNIVDTDIRISLSGKKILYINRKAFL